MVDFISVHRWAIVRIQSIFWRQRVKSVERLDFLSHESIIGRLELIIERRELYNLSKKKTMQLRASTMEESFQVNRWENVVEYEQ